MQLDTTLSNPYSKKSFEEKLWADFCTTSILLFIKSSANFSLILDKDLN